MAQLQGKRPLSPHLSIYKPIPTMVMSIFHRVTGTGLYFGVMLLALWLLAAASGPAWFDRVNTMFNSIAGRIVLLAASWALLHHMLGGIRHLIWDTGIWMENQPATRLAWATLAGSLVLTLLLWIAAYAMR